MNSDIDEEHENIRDKEWRLAAIDTLAKDFHSSSGTIFPEGTPVIQNSIIPFDGCHLGFGLPNMTALYLNFSHKQFIESEVYLKSQFYKAYNPKTPKNTYPESDEKIFDYLEKRSAAIIFAFSALETFANQLIPNDFIFEFERKDQRCSEKYKKDQIERNLPLDIKLNDVLPIIMNVPSPKGKTIWNKYLVLKKLRDRLIHLKTNDMRSVGIGEDSIWHELINKKHSNFAKEAKLIIQHFFAPDAKIPRWLKKIPF